MTIKEQLIRQAISNIEKRLTKIIEIIDARPFSEICTLRIQGQKLLEEYKTNEQQMSKEFMDQLHALATEETRLLKLAKKQKNIVKLIQERVNLQSELRDLKSEIYHINLRKGKVNENA